MKRTYHTEQRRRLIEFLASAPEKQYTIEEIASLMRGEDAPGKSTIYRLMNRLVEEGAVRRFVRGNSRQFIYQICSGEHCDAHLHLKCLTCGKLIHMDEELSDQMQTMLKKDFNFLLDENMTTLFGRCNNCTAEHRNALRNAEVKK